MKIPQQSRRSGDHTQSPSWLPVAHGRFPGKQAEVAEARELVRDALRGNPLNDAAVLVADELAANAVRHSASGQPGRTFRVNCYTNQRAIRVEVHDDGGSSEPQRREIAWDAETGRGLMLVDELAAHWGVTGDQHGRTVWVEINDEDSA